MIYSKYISNFFKRSANKNVKLVNMFFTYILIVISLIFIIVLSFWLKKEYTYLQKEISRIQKENIETQKENVKKETEKAVNYINYKISQADKDIKEKLSSRVNLAYSIVSNIYNDNKNNASPAEIKKSIKDALRPLRFDNGRGCFFIRNLNGYQELFVPDPECESKYIYNLKDDLGNYVIHNELEIVKTKGEGFVSTYWIRPDLDTNMTFKKLSFVKLFKPLNWYIGTGDYYIDFNSKIQEEILDWYSNYRFYEEGYIFINTYKGDVKLLNGEIITEKKNNWNLKDPNGVKVIQEQRKAVKNPDGDFIYYTWRKLTNTEIRQKISFVKGVPSWQWMVGAGVYIDDINQIIDAKKDEVYKYLKRNILIIILSLCILFIVLYFLTKYISNRVSNNINSVIQFFKNASDKNTLIDKSNINFYEFRVLADSANEMVSEIKKAQIQTQKEKAHFEKLFEESPEAIVFIDNEGLVKKINSEFTKLFGYNISDIINKDVDNCIVPSELRTQAQNFTKRFKDGYRYPVETIRVNKNNQKVYVSIIFTPFNINQKLIGYFVIYRDISKQKEFEQQLSDSKDKAEESDRLKTSFLTNLSHEIRTPLNAIIGFSTLLNTKQVPDDKQEEYLNILGNSGKLLLEIIENILDVSKIESSTLCVNKTTSNLNNILDELFIEFLEFKNNQKLDKIDLILKKEIEGRELYVFTDTKRVKQVFSNLLDNALKFTKEGQVEFGYYIKSKEIICFVKDTGIGIKKDEINFIYNRFRQADESLTRKYGGTGIGLALCKGLVELMDVKLWVKSEIEGKQKGANFYFSIPHEGERFDGNVQIKTKINEYINWKEKKILIAEDVVTNYKLLYNFLSNTNVEIHWAKDGKETVKMIEENPNFDLILMDINMPILTGHEALKILIDKGYNIPVIAQTAYASNEQGYEFRDLGYSDYILKPITLENLLLKVSKFLD